ncbi:hypothetical protein [Caballeronia arvi]|uniref:hypothetical protein n=1 Tax=Caballeronia arvi TaxID=1777135 RepID=UPI001357C2C1|nr:hypothetical protein [Caballeronia arvi]
MKTEGLYASIIGKMCGEMHGDVKTSDCRAIAIRFRQWLAGNDSAGKDYFVLM